MKHFKFFHILGLCILAVVSVACDDCVNLCNDDCCIEYLAFDLNSNGDLNRNVFAKVEERLLQNVRYEEGVYSLEHTSADKLCIEEKTYSFCKDVVLWALSNDAYYREMGSSNS